MRIAVIGIGYVGLVTGTCFSEMGNQVICVDVDKEKVQGLQKGDIPIYEPGLAELVQGNLSRGNLSFTTDIKSAVEESEICFIAVGTPMGEDGSADLQYVLSAACDIGRFMKNTMLIVDKSTVPVGTSDLVRKTIQKELERRKKNLEFDVVSNPEFLKEGTACADFMKPDRVIIGADSQTSLNIMQELYSPFLRSTEMLIAMDIRSAELTKYAANAMLATKISFINEMANICERVGADINKIRRGIGSDNRIGYSFIWPGCGYGGSCFPKDVQALVKTSRIHGYEAELLQSVESVNHRQKMILVQKILKMFGKALGGKVFAVWGLAFKPGTDDMREAPSVEIIRALISYGATVRAYDPKAEEQAKEFYLKDVQNVQYCQSKYDALDNVDALVLVTEWKEFRSPDFNEMAKRMKNKVIFDGRNQYSARIMSEYGFIYSQIGVQNK